jgi:hypothetical protein
MPWTARSSARIPASERVWSWFSSAVRSFTERTTSTAQSSKFSIHLIDAMTVSDVEAMRAKIYEKREAVLRAVGQKAFAETVKSAFVKNSEE